MRNTKKPSIRWDKQLARKYNLPKHIIQYAKHYGYNVETLLSIWVQQGTLKIKSTGNE